MKPGRKEGKKKENIKQTSNETRIVGIRTRVQYEECKNEDSALWESTYLLRLTIHMVLVFLLHKENGKDDQYMCSTALKGKLCHLTLKQSFFFPSWFQNKFLSYEYLVFQIEYALQL